MLKVGPGPQKLEKSKVHFLTSLLISDVPDTFAVLGAASIEPIFVLFVLPLFSFKTEIQEGIISPRQDTTNLKECLKRYRDATA